MDSISRKSNSIQVLKTSGIFVTDHLPPIEEEQDIIIRDEEELVRRLVSLWAVAGAALLPGNTRFRDWFDEHDAKDWLSGQEKAFLFASNPTEKDQIHFGWQVEGHYFLSWCCGLLNTISLPFEQSSGASILPLFPESRSDNLERLRSAIRIRSKEEIVDWADLLYRAHWAVREPYLQSNAARKLETGAVLEWHRAVNWVTHYDNENNWDFVGTDT